MSMQLCCCKVLNRKKLWDCAQGTRIGHPSVVSNCSEAGHFWVLLICSAGLPGHEQDSLRKAVKCRLRCCINVLPKEASLVCLSYKRIIPLIERWQTARELFCLEAAGRPMTMSLCKSRSAQSDPTLPCILARERLASTVHHWGTSAAVSKRSM